MAEQTLKELFQRCTVRLSIGGKHKGTGFFVARGLILTCAHVVRNSNSSQIGVFWRKTEQLYMAELNSPLIDSSTDLVLLKLTEELSDHPCVYLDSSEPGLNDDLYIFGYPVADNFEDYSDGDSVTIKYEGDSYKGNEPFLKFKEGQIRRGFSGSPVLNLTTEEVCGIISTSRNIVANSGGRAIPVKTVYSCFSDLKVQNELFHRKSDSWIKFLQTKHSTRSTEHLAKRCHIIGNAPQGIDSTFKDRREEFEEIIKLLTAEKSDIRSVIIYGRGGIGKTALACKIMTEIEKKNNAFALVYLSPRLSLGISVEQIYLSSAQAIGNKDEQLLKSTWVDSDVSISDKIQVLLSHYKGKRFILLLDNIEDILCKKTGSIADPDLALFVDAFIRQNHDSRLVITSREFVDIPNDVRRYQKSIFLEKGLPLMDALEFLQECDQDNSLELKITNPELLIYAVEKTYGYPRALEAIIGILYKDPFTTLENLLENKYLFDKEVINRLVGEALSRLSDQEYRVMQVLAAYRRPVSSNAVCFILESSEEETDVHSLLKQLARSRYINVNRQTKKISLHPMDNDSIYSSILSDSSSNRFNKQYLESRIADYYVERRTPKETWRNLADLEPQLLEFEHRCKADEYNKAAKVLTEIDDTLLLWGIHRRVVEQHKILQTKISDQKLQLTHLFSLSRGYRNLGYYVESIDCCNQALSIAEIHNEQGFVGGILGNLGNCYTSLGQVDEAIHYYQRALEVAINERNRLLEGFWSNNLGVCYADLGNMEEAIHYYRLALGIALENCELETQGTCFGNLCDCYSSLGETLLAIECGEAALSIQEAIQDWIGQGTTLHSLAEVMMDEQNYEEAIKYANRGLEIGMKTENPKIKSENNCILACAYFYKGSEKLSLAINAATSARENNAPQNNYYVSLLLGIILLKQGNKESACEAFTKSIDQINKLFNYNSKNYKILDIKWLALCGLCLCKNYELKTIAIETYYIAKEIYRNSGIRNRTQKLFSEILLLDSDRILSDVQEIFDQR